MCEVKDLLNHAIHDVVDEIYDFVPRAFVSEVFGNETQNFVWKPNEMWKTHMKGNDTKKAGSQRILI